MSENATPIKPGHVLYMSLEAAREGHATFAHIHEIIAGLRRRGWIVDLFVPGHSKNWRRPPLFLRMIEYLFVQWRVMRAFEDGQIVYVRGHVLSLPIALWARVRGAPIVQEINGPYDDVAIAYEWAKPFAGLIAWMSGTQFRLASHLITVTPQLAQWIKAQGIDRPVDVVPNGANTELFHPGATCDLDLPETYAVFFGGLARWQGIPTLLAAKAAPDWPAGVDLVIVGDGPERPAVEAAAAADPGIRYVGRQPYKVLPGIVAGSLCGLVPKNNRGDRTGTGLYPLKVFETLSCGVPAIVTDFPGQADLVRENAAGVAVPAEDPTALARAVADLAADPAAAQTMGGRGRAAIVAAHSWDRRAEQTADVLNGLRAGRGGR